MNDIAINTAKMLLTTKAVTFSFYPPYTYTTGIRSPIYIDIRRVISYPKIRKKIINYYLKVIKNRIGLSKFNYITSTATAGIPYGAWIADKLNLPMIYIRPTTKSYGLGGKVQGYLKKGSKVLVIEDLFSTGTSAIETVKTVRESGCEARYCIAVNSYDTNITKQNAKKNEVKFFSLTNTKTIIKIGFKIGYLTRQEKIEVENWFVDPKRWYKRFMSRVVR